MAKTSFNVADDAHPTSSSALTFVVVATFLAFLHFTSGLRRNRELREFDLYLAINVAVNFWLFANLAMYAFDSLGGRGNVVVSGSLFFPVFVASLGMILVTKGGTRLVGRFRDWLVGEKFDTKFPTALRWWRPLRAVFSVSIMMTVIICVVQAHCWSRALGDFKRSFEDGSGLVCDFLFEDGRNTSSGALDIWKVWGALIVVYCATLVTDEEAMRNNAKMEAAPTRLSRGISGTAMPTTDLDYDSEDMEGLLRYDRSSPNAGDSLFRDNIPEKPQNTLMMVPWYSLLLVYTAFDIVIQLSVFMGRYDARTMQPAVHGTWGGKRKKKKKKRGKRKGRDQGEADNDDGDDDGDGDDDLDLCGCVFDEKSSSSEIWFDFMADCGDGFNSSYQVARVLADPKLTVLTHDRSEKRTLPRGEFLVVGGDLAYPDPSPETFEKRFFRTFEDALPPPPCFRKDAISTKKPNLANTGWSNIFTSPPDDPTDPDEVLEKYKGPKAYIIPGNHDWFDGLATYTRLILSRDWLGGWLIPHERSYMAIALPHGWHILGVDLALSEDIDLEQFKFFADYCERRVGPDDAVVIVTHEPYWVIDAQEFRNDEECAECNLRELMETHLAGKVRARLAGDLHHYTRHVPVKRGIPTTNGTGSFDVNATYSAGDAKGLAEAAAKISKGTREGRVASEPTITGTRQQAVEENLPELIVSGGGGAFLHPTHTFAKNIKVNFGKMLNKPYTRTCAYPSVNACYRLSWLNIWQFRWRNWRLDFLWFFLYLGISCSLLPLCGIYTSYVNNAYNKGALTHLVWYFGQLGSLTMDVFRTGHISLILIPATVLSLYNLCDAGLSPKKRLVWGCSHGVMHVIAALSCALFVEWVTEWSMATGIVTTQYSHASGNQTTLGHSLYDTYSENFAEVFEIVTPTMFTKQGASDSFHQPSIEGVGPTIFQFTYDAVSIGGSWMAQNLPLLKFLMLLFDLPGLTGTKHAGMCKILCEEGAGCLGSKDPLLFARVSRWTIGTYMGCVSAYFFVLAIPAAGSIFGSWLALTLNVFNVQYNEGFSSLRIQHWKNVLRCHITKNGDLEVYGIGLDRVPKDWVKDSKWDGSPGAKAERERARIIGKMKGDKSSLDKGDTPSFEWLHPSTWVPNGKRNVKHIPRIIDYTLIRKRHGQGGGKEEEKEEGGGKASLRSLFTQGSM